MLLAWHNEPKLKSAALEQLHRHRKMDELIQGQYFATNGKGCHLGCLTHENRGAHEATERMFGIPVRVAYWLEAVFEGLPESDCANWVIESTEAIPVGADLSLSHHHLFVWLLGPDSPADNSNELVAEAISRCRELHEIVVSGGVVTSDQWFAAESAAESAAWSAAWSAQSAQSAARFAAESAAWSAAESAESAARSAARYAAQSAESAARFAAESAAWSAARYAAWHKIAEKSIEIFKSAPVVTECDYCEEAAERSIIQVNSTVRV